MPAEQPAEQIESQRKKILASRIDELILSLNELKKEEHHTLTLDKYTEILEAELSWIKREKIGRKSPP